MSTWRMKVVVIAFLLFASLALLSAWAMGWIFGGSSDIVGKGDDTTPYWMTLTTFIVSTLGAVVTLTSQAVELIRKRRSPTDQ